MAARPLQSEPLLEWFGWRFYRLFNQVYAYAFYMILMIEKAFGTQLREYAVRISKERYELRRDILSSRFESAKDVSLN